MLSCALIAFQDIKERMVTWLLFPLVGLALALVYLMSTSFEQFYPFIMTNVLLISSIILVLFLYSKYIAGVKFLNVSFGLGDLLFFYAFAFGFPTITFLILFVGSILFSLAVFVISKGKQKDKTIPLAGFMSIFLIMVITFSALPSAPSLYLL